MYKYGHYGVALISYAPIFLVTTIHGLEKIAIFGGVTILLLCMVPDFDHNIPYIKHRGITHTVWFALLVGLITGFIVNLIPLEVMGLDNAITVPFMFFVGFVSIISHIIADSLTPAGVKPLWPVIKNHYTVRLVNANNTFANYLLLFIGIIAYVIIWGYIKP